MKNEAVTIKPTASSNTESVGYSVSGTGEVIGFADGAIDDELGDRSRVSAMVSAASGAGYEGL